MDLFKLNKPIGALLLGGGLCLTLPSQAQQVGTVEQSIIEEIVVTAQRKEESAQTVPIALSAFSTQDMNVKKIESGIDLQNYVPNLSYTGGSGIDFSIRGVGAAVGGTTGDNGVGVHINNIPIVVQSAGREIYDLERLEVLRGPQGTLYGRNATGGVINYLWAKPDLDEQTGSVFLEYADPTSTKASGHFNLPISETLAMRFSGLVFNRDGYTTNVATGNDVDGRDEWSLRWSTLWEPTENMRFTFMAQHSEEDSTRNGGTSTQCFNDPGPTTIGSTSVTNTTAQLFLSRGCEQGSVYDDEAFGNFNSVATFGGRYAYLLSVNGSLPGLVPGDVFANQTRYTDPRENSYYIDPEYIAETDFLSFDSQFYLSDTLQLNVLMGWQEDKLDTRTGSEEASTPFGITAVTPPPEPGATFGVFTDAQGGVASGVRTLTTTDNYTEQFSTELRLQSDLDGPFNFNLGAFIYNVERENILFISTNSTTIFAAVSGLPLYFDTSPDPRTSDYDGHQYFVTRTPYELDSQAIFGEAYFDISDTVRLTAGFRYTKDEKVTDSTPVLLFIPEGANGIGTAGHPTTGSASIREQSVDFDEWTGRLLMDWAPRDNTLIYASIATGYKSGGFNSPDDPSSSASFSPYDPETVTSFEIGTKNLFFDGRFQFNANMFFMDYKDYQVSFVEQFSARNTNVDAEVLGMEIEMALEPIDNLLLTANIGLLDSEIQNGTAIDPFDRIQGQAGLTYLVTPQTGCVVQTAALEPLIALINGGFVPPEILANAGPGSTATSTPDPDDICENAYSGAINPYGNPNPLFGSGVDIEATPGIQANVEGNELPNSPPLSYNLSAAYTIASDNWDTTIRADYAWKDDTYTSHFNGENYELRSWQNANIVLNFENVSTGLGIQVFAKNVLNDDDTIVGYDLSGQGLGLGRNVTYLDPRVVGASVSYEF